MIKYYLSVLLAVIGGSAAVVFGKLATAPSMVLVVYRMAFASLFLLPLMIIRRKEYKKLNRKSLIFAVFGGIVLGLHFSLFFQGLKLTSVASASVMCNTQVVFVAFFSAIILRKRYSVFSYLSIAVAFLGAAIMALFGSSGDGGNLLGDILALVSAAGLAIYTMISSYCRKSMDTGLYTTITYPMAALTALIIALVSGNAVIGYEPINIAAALGLTVFCTFMGHSLFSFSLKALSPSLVSTMQLLDSLFCVIWGILFFSEIPSVPVVIGGIIATAGVLFFCSINKDN